MTLQQLKYMITVADTGTITEAANKLYISQPSLTNAIHELEKEMNIVIFNRTNKGISLSKEGEIFLGYANIREMMVVRNSSVYQPSIIHLPSMHLWIWSSSMDRMNMISAYGRRRLMRSSKT